MDFIRRFWQSIIGFFSTTPEDWKNFRRRTEPGGSDGSGYSGDVDSGGDCGDGGCD